MENGSKNILIEYTKWIVKWLLIIILGLCVLGGLFWSYYVFTNSKVPMIALKCVYESKKKPPSPHYMIVMKRRSESEPEGLYSGAYERRDFNLDTSVTDLASRKYFVKSKSTGMDYFFSAGDYKFNNDVILNRETLKKTDIIGTNIPNKNITLVSQCKKITTDEFYYFVKIKVNERKKKLKF